MRLNASWRARFWNRERPTADPIVVGASPDEHRRVDDRVVLVAALAALPVRQRQVVVLRYFDDLSVDATAEIMGSSTGTVKSQTAKALAKLRDAIGSTSVELEET